MRIVSTETRRAVGASTIYTLVASLEGTELQRVELSSAALTIGRLPENNLVLRDQAVSRRHAELRLEKGRPMLADSGSASGTYVGGERLLAGSPVVLEPGVEVRIGPYVLTLTSEATLVPPLPPVYAPPDVAIKHPDVDELPTVIARLTWPAPLPTTGTFSLIVSLDDTELRRVDLSTTALTIGRLPDNGLVLRDQSVSPRHAELRLEKGRPILVDSGSASGTYVGGMRVRAGIPIAFDPGLDVRIGPYLLTLKSARSRYTQHLPAIFQDADFLGRMLLIFEAIWEPLEQRQEHIAMYFSPETSPVQMLAWMAEWLNLELDSHWPERRRRQLLREATQLYQWRGTRYGLTRMLEICTDQEGVKITEDPDRPFVFRITIPRPTDVSRDFIERLVRAHKPAHVGYVLEINPK
jgi:phage tail-like protein